MREKLVPDYFAVPGVLETSHFRLRMLTVDDVNKDYEAVMSSVDHLKGFFGPLLDWPSEDLTLEQNFAHLQRHQDDFLRRIAFTYTVMSLDESECLGCVYIFPAHKPGYDAEIYLWVRASHLHKGLDETLFRTIKVWIDNEWPFDKTVYPGREVDWEEWGTPGFLDA